jgi:hypothetical protein
MANHTTPDVYGVFKTQGQPTVTYVARDDGTYERKLADGIQNKGTVCLLTGPSKTGKTTLYTKTAENLGLTLIRARCDRTMAARDVWRKALEDVDFAQIVSTQTKSDASSEAMGEISGSIGWGWLAGLASKVSVKTGTAYSETEVRQRVLADASPAHLVPLLKKLTVLFVLEDLHYLSTEVQTTIFQQWKVFVDEEISVVLVSTTHHAVDLAYANKDLVGRMSHIDVATWKTADLEKIARQGFEYLNVRVPETLVRTLADEAVGLPIVTQAACLELMLRKGITEPLPPKSVPSAPGDILRGAFHQPGNVAGGFKNSDVFAALHTVATEKFGSFEAIYQRLILGLRKQRKYKTYELILSAFTFGTLAFSSTQSQVFERIKTMPILPERIPPSKIIGRAMKSLSALQSKIGLELLEWVERDQKLFIVEPTFLFYLRWRVKKEETPKWDEVLTHLLSDDVKDFKLLFLSAAGHVQRIKTELHDIDEGIAALKRQF